MGEYALMLILALSAEPAPWQDAVVVRPSAWSNALKPWKQYRLGQSIRVHEIDAEKGAEEIVQSIRSLAARPNIKLEYVMLAGDVAEDPSPDRRNAARLVPTCYQSSTAMARFGSEPHIATDNTFADLNGDYKPELAVGRIPADNPEQLAVMLQNTIDFERNADFSMWRRNVHVVAGIGGFGALIDSVVEMTTRRFLTDSVPSWAELSMTYACPGSPFCPDPFRFGQAAIERMNQGGAFWVYVGHGHVETLDKVQVNDELLDILTTEQVDQVDCRQCPPIAVFLACYTGAFDASRDCLAEQLLKSRSGPVAALAASRMTGPYGMSLMASGMLTACYEHQNPRLGKIILHAKQEMLRDDANSGKVVSMNQSAANTPVNKVVSDTQRPIARGARIELINSLAAAFSPDGHDLAQERLEHVWEMNLLGDPMLRLIHPQPLSINIPQRVQPGATIAVAGTAPIPGQLRVELVLSRDSLPRDLRPIKRFSSNLADRNAMQRCYELANARVLNSCDKIVAIGNFDALLNAPKDLPAGRYSVRAFLEGASGWAAGESQISIRKSSLPSQ